MRRCSRRRVSLVCIKAPDVQMESAICVTPGPLSNLRMQPTGRMGARLRSGAAFLERAVERRFVWAPAGGAAADAPFVRPHRPGDPLDSATRAQIEAGLASADEDRRWQAAIRLGELVHPEPDAVWPVVARWGTSDDSDTRMAIATCVLEHLLEHHFEMLFPRVEQLALAD